MALAHWPLTSMTTLMNLLQLFIPILLVRVFSAEEMGAYKIFFLYVQLFPLLAMTGGFINGVSYWSGDPAKRGARLSQAWSLLVVLNLFVCCSVVLLLPWAKSIFFGSPWLALLFALSGALFFIVSFHEEVWVANGMIWRTALFRSITEVARSLSMLGVAYYTRRVDCVIFVHCAFMMLRMIIVTLMSRRDGIVRWIWSAPLVREIWRYALPTSLAAILYAISNSTDQILLSRLLPLDQFAIFSLGCILVPPLFALEQSVNQLLVAKVAQYTASGEAHRAPGLIAYGIRELSSFMIPSSIGLIIFAEPIIRIIYTDAYIAAVPVLQVFALRYLLNSFPYDVGPKATGDGGWGLRIFVRKTVLSLLLTPLFIWWWGVRGAIVAVFLSDLFLRASGLAFNARRFNWRYSEFIPFAAISVQLILALLLGLVSLELRNLFADSRIWFLVCGGGFSVVYSLLILVPLLRKRSAGGP